MANFLPLISLLHFSNYSPFASRSPKNMEFLLPWLKIPNPLVQGDQVQGLIKLLTPITATPQNGAAKLSLYVQPV